MKLDILYEDEFLVAIDKPHGLFVHRTNLGKDEDQAALQILRDQIGTKVSPIHRLDRKTSGIVLYSKNKEIHHQVAQQFEQGLVKKEYTALVRGFTPPSEIIDYNLVNLKEKSQQAVTSYSTFEHIEVAVPFGKFSTSRYSLVKAIPKTGRYHQLRKHFAHIFHPIIGDRPHGCNKQNKLFLEKWNISTMMLCATQLTFFHPLKNEKIRIECPASDDFRTTMKLLTALRVSID